ncbi:50S ribosomal protein L6 [Candidatus Microgenomates bacterium]|nr:50S ribosomal protein L6 [Candidatus Microgenomates bacterium]
MSRVGKKPIEIPEGVRVTVDNSRVIVVGPKGELALAIPTGIYVKTENSLVVVERTAASSAIFGRVRATLANMVYGVNVGWRKTLEIIGTGYRAATDGKELTLHLGFSHPIVVTAPEEIQFSVQQNKITVEGTDKQRVGLVAAQIRSYRPPDSYKGKGVRYEGEVVRKKPGKAAKGAVS